MQSKKFGAEYMGTAYIDGRICSYTLSIRHVLSHKASVPKKMLKCSDVFNSLPDNLSWVHRPKVGQDLMMMIVVIIIMKMTKMMMTLTPLSTRLTAARTSA